METALWIGNGGRPHRLGCMGFGRPGPVVQRFPLGQPSRSNAVNDPHAGQQRVLRGLSSEKSAPVAAHPFVSWLIPEIGSAHWDGPGPGTPVAATCEPEQIHRTAAVAVLCCLQVEPIGAVEHPDFLPLKDNQGCMASNMSLYWNAQGGSQRRPSRLVVSMIWRRRAGLGAGKAMIQRP